MNTHLIAQRLRTAVNRAQAHLVKMDPDQVARKETPTGWSKKEILGHLIDSAANNHQRFVRACHDGAADFPTYDQNQWVQTQHHNEANWHALIELWAAYNRHLSHVIEHLPQKAMDTSCNIGKEMSVTLEFMVEDYVRHLRHHLKRLGV